MPTAVVLVKAERDRRDRRRRGVNGSLAAVASHATVRQALWVVLHVLGVYAVVMGSRGTPQPWAVMTLCVLLAVASVMELAFRRRMEGRFWRERASKMQNSGSGTNG